MNLFVQLKSRIGWVVVGYYGGLNISLGFCTGLLRKQRRFCGRGKKKLPLIGWCVKIPNLLGLFLLSPDYNFLLCKGT